MKSTLFLGQLKAKGKNVEWLIVEMKKHGTNVSYSTVYKKLRGQSEFKAKEIKTISEIMEYSKEEMYNIFFEELVS